MSPARTRRRCLVLGYDGSDGARKAASWAVNELLPKGTLILVHSDRALHVPASPLSSTRERTHIGHAIIDELLLDGDDALADLDLVTEVSEKDPVSALVSAAERHDADAIVVGCEPHSRLRRALGVVTDELLARSPVAVIAVPQGAKVKQRASATRGAGQAPRTASRRRPSAASS
jgi:nucleotide-binding universal stress UspA family protein